LKEPAPFKPKKPPVDIDKQTLRKKLTQQWTVLEELGQNLKLLRNLVNSAMKKEITDPNVMRALTQIIAEIRRSLELIDKVAAKITSTKKLDPEEYYTDISKIFYIIDLSPEQLTKAELQFKKLEEKHGFGEL
jgi:hypothetical protein